jgi:uncharacterized protein Yka (UPF0111/DUF47 family)
MKSRIVEELGQSEILLPGLVAAGLRANDRAKVRLSALQAALQHARDPGAAPADLAAECRSAGIDAVAIKSFVAAARSGGNGFVEAPGLAKFGQALLADVEAMIEAVAAADASKGKAAEDRLAAIKTKLDLGKPVIGEAEIAEVTAVSSGEHDSLHRFIMDLHKELNRLAAQCAEEIVGGAHTHGLAASDKPAVAAFMRGLNRTRELKFDHPGLDTIAIRSGARLIIQNDIGTTDAHVLLVSVEGLSVTITHTDVHEARAKFFVALFDAFPVQWSGLHQEKAEGLAGGEAFYLINGRYEAESEARRDSFLAAIGAALVFLIDWNKARKALRRLTSNEDAVHVLDWAARHEIGHRGFLELGGADLVAAAVRHATPARIGFGEELGRVLGRETTIDFLETALKLATDAMRKGRSARAVREAIEADLVTRIERTESALLTTIVRQMGLARDIAAGIAATLAEPRPERAWVKEAAARAQHIEKKADAIAVEARGAIARSQGSAIVARLVDKAEDAIDELEQAAFYASLVPLKLAPDVLEPLHALCNAAVAGAEAAARGLEAAGAIADGDSVDSADALAATDRLADLEHEADRAERAVTATLFQANGDMGSALSVLELARALERATDRLSALGHLLRDHVMADLSG